MRTIEYKPVITTKVGEAELPVFGGTVTINMPSYKERLILVKELNFEVKDGEVKVSGKGVDMAVQMYDMTDKHIKSVDLTKTETGEIFNSLEDLGYDSDGTEVIQELQSVIINGNTLGKR